MLSRSDPEFVSSFDIGDFVYFFFREHSLEHASCGRVVYSRVARLCKVGLHCTSLSSVHYHDVPVVANLFNTADDDFLHRVKTNSDHAFQPYLPDPINIPYQLRNRSHNSITLINKTKFLNDTNFIIRMLYKYSYWHTIYNPSIRMLISPLFIKHSHADCLSLIIVFQLSPSIVYINL